MLPDLMRRILAHWVPTLTAVQSRHMWPEQLHVITDFRHRPHRRAGGSDRITLFDSDGRRYAFDAIDLRLVHPVQELARVRRKGLDVPALPLGKKSVKGK